MGKVGCYREGARSAGGDEGGGFPGSALLTSGASPRAQTAGPCPMPSPPASCRKQCIELEQQFDFLKDLVASVPDMQGDGEDNHMDGDKGARRWGARAKRPDEEGRGRGGRRWLGAGEGAGRWTVPSHRGRKPGSSSRKNGGMGSKGKDKKLSGTDSEQEVSEALSPLPCPSMLAEGPIPSSPAASW